MNSFRNKIIAAEIVIVAMSGIAFTGYACASRVSVAFTIGLLVGAPLVAVLCVVFVAGHYALDVVQRLIGKRFWCIIVQHIILLAASFVAIRLLSGTAPDLRMMLNTETGAMYAEARIQKAGWFKSIPSGSFIVAVCDSVDPPSENSGLNEVQALRIRGMALSICADLSRFAGIDVDVDSVKEILWKDSSGGWRVYILKENMRDIVIAASGEYRWLESL